MPLQKPAMLSILGMPASHFGRESDAGAPFWCAFRSVGPYSARLQNMAQTAREQAEPAPGLSSPDGPRPRGEERRHGERRQDDRRAQPRHKCAGGAEVCKQGVDARVWGTLADISLGGCYVEMLTPFPMETEVELDLGVGSRRLRAAGVVRTSHPGCGMGVQFTSLSDHDRAELEQLTVALAAGSAATSDTSSPASPPATPVPSADGTPSYAGRVLQSVLAFFGERDVLTRREFLELLRRAKLVSEPRDRSLG